VRNLHPVDRTMDYTLVIGLLVVLVVGFFGYQWFSASKRPVAAKRGATAAVVAAPTAPTVAAAAAVAAPAPVTTAPPKEEAYPKVAGQTEAEMRTKEPIQRRTPPSQQQPVTHDGAGPAYFDEELRHPEQSYYQPQVAAAAPGPQLRVSDVPSGRAAQSSTPLSGNQQAFTPEMAQNGGALVGNSMFAYDGMEPTGFSAF
jgi:hypothetical protein